MDGTDGTDGTARPDLGAHLRLRSRQHDHPI